MPRAAGYIAAKPFAARIMVALALLASWLSLATCATVEEPPPAAVAVEAKTLVVPEAASGFVQVPAVHARQWLAATNNPHATAAAAAILREGGSALDAAIAAQVILGLVEPQSSGIGGGAFLLYWDNQEGELRGYDGRETAPAAVTPGHFLDAADEPMGFLDAVVGGHAVGVPGVLRMLELAHQRHGRLPWATLFHPAIALAESGFAISPRLHTLLRDTPRLTEQPAMRDYFFTPDGAPKPVGTLLRNLAYADTLRRIAAGGADAFYEGPIARDMVAAVQGAGRPGLLAIEDLQRYAAVERAPVCGAYRQYRVCGAAPPSSGGTTVLAILGMLQHVDPSLLKPGSVSFYHLFSEASRLAFADRNTYVADPDFVPIPTAGLVDPEYLARRARLLSATRRLPEAVPGQPPAPDAAALRHIPSVSPELVSTSQITVVDRFGDALTMTTSIETAFGSRLLVRGFLLNNQLTDFSFAPAHAGAAIANRIEAGKRPRSSMAPTIVFENERPRILTGSPGGARIIDYVAKTLIYTLNDDLPLAASIASPHITEIGGGVELEAGRVAEPVIKRLRALGHRVVEMSQTSGLNGIVIAAQGLPAHGNAPQGEALQGWALTGSVDPRREGLAAGQ